MKRTCLLLLTVLCASSAFAAGKGVTINGSQRSITLPNQAVALKDGKGVEVTRGYCAICHSLDYITTQQKFPRASWQAVVTKMIKVYGAPINADNARLITDYIAAAYGTGD